MATEIQHIRTLRLKVKAEGHAWLNAAAIEVNQVWNFANATSYKAARPFAGQPKWLTAFDLDKLTAGQASALNVLARRPFSGSMLSMRPVEGNSSYQGLTGASARARSVPWAGCLSKRCN
jgi:hypothetical protein